MTIQEIHYDFMMKMDRINSHSQPNFLKAEIDWLINEAGLVFLKQRSGTNNSKNKGFENTQKRIDDLSTLSIKYPNQPYLTPVKVDSNIYEVDLSALEYDYFAITRVYCDAVIDGCSKTSIPLKFSQTDDITDIIRDPFNSPSEEFIPYNIGKSSTSSYNSIYIYPIDATISKVYIEYLKYPAKVSSGGQYIDGVVYPEQTLDFPEHTHTEIVDIAVAIAATNIESPEYIQLKNSKLQINE